MRRLLAAAMSVLAACAGGNEDDGPVVVFDPAGVVQAAPPGAELTADPRRRADVAVLDSRHAGRPGLDPPERDPTGADPRAVEAFTVGGRLTCVPGPVTATVAFYNPALFDRAGVPHPRPGWTVADLRAAAGGLRGAGIDAVGFSPTVAGAAPLVWAAGGDVVDDLHRPTRVTFGSDRAKEALALLAELAALGSGVAADPPEDRFARGVLAVLLADGGVARRFERSDRLVARTAPLPQGEASATLLWARGFCVAGNSGRKAAAHRVAADLARVAGPGAAPPEARRLPNGPRWPAAEAAADRAIADHLAGRLPLDDAVRRAEAESAKALSDPR